LSSCSSQEVISLIGVTHKSDRCGFPGAGRSSAPVRLVQGTDLIGRSKAEAAALFCEVVCMHSSRGSCIGSGGSCTCAVELFVVLEFWFGGLCSLLELVFVSVVLSHCPCLRGPRLVFSSDLDLCLPFGFRSFVEISFSHFFSFPFLFRYQNVCVVNAIIKGEIESLCGSRTGGWSLPSAMSD
jgi:hypothetical protein